MKRKATLWLILLALAALIGLFAGTVSAGTYTFDSNPPPDWGNELGNWIASGGVYYSQVPGPPIYGYAYSSLPFNLTNFTFEADMSNLYESGVFLHSNYSGSGGIPTGLLFVESRYGETYFVAFHADGTQTQLPGTMYDYITSTHLEIVVEGDTYSAYSNGVLINSIIYDEFSSGKVALFGDYLSNGSWDNVQVVPIPGAILLLGSGLLGLAGLRRFRKG